MSKGLKIKNTTSTIPPIQPNPVEKLDEEALKAIQRFDGYKTKSKELGLKFKAIMEDQTLLENKSSLSKDLEQEIINKLSELALEINEDQAQPEGAGSTALCQLLMKMLIHQRDIINNLSYQISILNKK